MISSQQALDETIRILKSNLPDVSGEEGSSHAYGFYQVAKNIFVKFRVADHGLYMQTFVSHQNGVPPELVSIISVVYRDNPKKAIGTKWKTKGYPKQITVYQYVYPCWDMDIKDIAPIAMELIKFAKTNRFIPPHLCTKDVKVQEIISDTGVRDITNQMKAQYCTIDESIIINDNKRYKNMNRKNAIRLTESELKNIIAESVKNILREQQDGNVTDNPIINQLWNELMSINQGLIKEILQKYGWGKSKELGNGVFKQIVKVSEAINTFDAVLRNRTADSDYWAMSAHEQD